MEKTSSKVKSSNISFDRIRKIARFTIQVIGERKLAALILTILMAAAAVAEMAGIGSLLPLIQLIVGQVQDAASAPLPLKFLYRMLQNIPQEQRTKFLCLTVAGLNVLGFAVRIIMIRFRARFTQGLRMEWRNSLMNQYLSGSLTSLASKKKGTLLNNIINEPAMAEKFIYGVFEVLMLTFSSLAIISLLWLMHWQATLGCLTAAGFITCLLYPLFVKKPLKLGKHRLALQQEITSQASENISGLKQIKAFSLEKTLADTFRRINKKLTIVWIKISVLNQIFRPLLEVLAVLGVCTFIALAPVLIKTPLNELAAFFIFFTAIISKVVIQLAATLSHISMLTNRLPAVELIRKWVHGKLPKEDLQKGAPFNNMTGNIKFQDVNFAFPGKEPVFSNLSLTIPQKAMTAIVGPSGSGKTTLIDLLIRLYEPSKGDIIITPNISLSSIALGDWRNNIGLVTQETFLFNMTIRENILIANPNASDEEILNASELCHAHDFIEQMPDTYNTILHDRGANLSGGQRQRISIARAILRNPQIYIFDEPTSAIDSVSTQFIQNTILNLSKAGKTVIVISHDLAVVRHAEIIHVLDSGHLVESGNYNDLSNKQGLFLKLIQAKEEKH
ncbi:ABC transporter ATP-binding protein [Verrucomicrobiota bacterium]